MVSLFFVNAFASYDLYFCICECPSWPLSHKSVIFFLPLPVFLCLAPDCQSQQPSLPKYPPPLILICPAWWLHLPHNLASIRIELRVAATFLTAQIFYDSSNIWVWSVPADVAVLGPGGLHILTLYGFGSSTWNYILFVPLPFLLFFLLVIQFSWFQ